MVHGRRWQPPPARWWRRRPRTSGCARWYSRCIARSCLPPPGSAGAPTAAPPPAAAFAAIDPPPPKPPDEDTAELRLRIDETRDRIRRRAEDDALRGGAPPAGDAPPQAG